MQKIRYSKVVFPCRQTFAIEYTDNVVDLILKLLDKNRDTRLGSQNDAQEILQHEWFSDIDITALEAMQLPAPIMPSNRRASGTPDLQRFNVSAQTVSLEQSFIPERAR